MCAGDFNEILDNSDRWDKEPRNQWKIEAFKRALGDCNRNDLNPEDTTFTWWNDRKRIAAVHEKLQGSGKSRLVQKIPLSECGNSSDHLLVFIRLLHLQLFLKILPSWFAKVFIRKGRLSYQTMWLRAEVCEKLIEKAWRI